MAAELSIETSTRAVFGVKCRSCSPTWLGPWRLSYVEAGEDLAAHRKWHEQTRLEPARAPNLG